MVQLGLKLMFISNKLKKVDAKSSLITSSTAVVCHYLRKYSELRLDCCSFVLRNHTLSPYI